MHLHAVWKSLGKRLSMFRILFETNIQKLSGVKRQLFRSEEFRNDLTAQDALARSLEIIGEAIKHVPDSIRNKYPEVEWRKATALRDVLAHDYVDVEIDRLYLAVTQVLPSFRDQIAAVLVDLETK